MQEQSGLIFLPKSKILLNLDTISFIRIYPPHEIKLEFPEIKTKIKRKNETKWCCMVYYGTNEVRVSGEEAISLIELLSPSIMELKIKEDKEDSKNKEE